MRWPLPLLVAIAILLSLVLLLTTVGSLAQLYGAIAFISPLLAQLILALVLVALIGALFILGRYAWMFLRPKRKSAITLPTKADEVAALNLQATQQQVAQIKDEITRQVLAEKSNQLAQQLTQQTFQIVVFGLGSTGKTALVNALVGEMAGQVAATIGTTEEAVRHRVRVPVAEGERELLILDTPGLLESGVLGEARSQTAKAQATQADLLLFVIDNDLHRAEYEPLQLLMGMGKRSLLVFNKCDRYLPTEVEQILTRLKERTQHLLTPEDIIAATALPAPIELPDGTSIQPEPQVENLIERILSILQTESTELMASNVLLQSQKLGEEARDLLTAQRQQQAEAIVERYQWVGAGVLAATPLPVVDMLATAAVNAQMVIELGRVYGIEVSIEEAKALAVSLTKTMAGLSVAKGAMKMLAVGLQVNLATAVASKLVQGASAAYLTRIAGKSFITYFQANQDWGDGGIQAVVERQYQLNRRDEFVKQFLHSAVERLERSRG
ncbi:MAG: GTP-binding protein [Cyanobacteria bacterium J06621_11]